MAPKTPKGELSSTELRKLIRAHNILSKITVPKGTDRLGLIKIIEDRRFKINHKLKRIEPKPTRGNIITLKTAEEITKPKPVAESVKKQRAEKKKQQEEEKQKEIKLAKKEAVKEFKSKKKEASILKNKKENINKKKMKKENEIRPKEKVGRPKVDPKKIKVIEPKKKEEPKKEESKIEITVGEQGEGVKTIGKVEPTLEAIKKIIIDNKGKVSKKAEKEILKYIEESKNEKRRDIFIERRYPNQKLGKFAKSTPYKWRDISFGSGFITLSGGS